MKLNPKAKIEKACARGHHDGTILRNPRLVIGKRRVAELQATNRVIAVSVPVEIEKDEEQGIVPVEAIRLARRRKSSLSMNNGQATVLGKDLSVTVSFERPKDHGKKHWPNFDNFKPKGEPTVELGINAAYLHDAAEALGADGIRVQIYNPDEPIVVTPLNDDGGHALVMPIRIAKITNRKEQ